ncbi:hypothetical protein TVAG_197050 [Trichomonas vaginalis G3]|uniref:Uncharacterized protein n=1 Tax=Trichomonas vaginalis (strain ATCC PRA-98 / G3) TaxID=412133 RepID=A2EPH5_TRIV3|nr:hypothetical protein TVAGG3_0599660 [Trichomonas vaginalis G3]EAY05404.1 hypothetical protein TVAG_197050 [Trichomonas vaginalis G3]KAI5523844.1 hypothetical protein TVAGG3_0599660 [Trichomonas vaginalis G3]|eukprot:XP_001317627.1 hypothetical protein [Trichomonas vaginalis G3]
MSLKSGDLMFASPHHLCKQLMMLSTESWKIMTGILLNATDAEVGSLEMMYSHFNDLEFNIESPKTSANLFAVVEAVDFLSPYSVNDFDIVEDSLNKSSNSLSSIVRP